VERTVEGYMLNTIFKLFCVSGRQYSADVFRARVAGGAAPIKINLIIFRTFREMTLKHKN
jgi:hypothetical protein